MAGYYARIIKRSATTRSYFDEGDTTSVAIGWTHGCLSCSRKLAVTVDRLEQHIDELEDELREAKKLLADLKENGLSRDPGASSAAAR